MKITFPKGFFIRAVVILCLGYTVWLTERSFALCEKLGISPEGVYIAAIAFFGGELLLTMAKTIVDKIKTMKEDET